MNLKRTIALSALFHVCLFTAAVLFSAGLPGHRTNTIEKMIFVELTADKDVDKNDQSRVEANKAASSKNRPVIIKKHEVPVERDVAVTADTINRYAPDTRATGEQVKKISFVSKTDVTVSYDPLFSSDDRSSKSRDKGVLPAGIIETIRSSIERAKTYPVLARKKEIEGTVYIGFRIGPRGEPEDLRIIKGSGSSILDKATLAIVKRAAPFPNLDSPVEVPVVFRLTD